LSVDEASLLNEIRGAKFAARVSAGWIFAGVSRRMR
jgi:hypothetical protein